MDDRLGKKSEISAFSYWHKRVSKFVKYEILHRKKRREKDWLKERKRVLKEASIMLPYNISLDVIKRNGI
jgi:hypothetical protein